MLKSKDYHISYIYLLSILPLRYYDIWSNQNSPCLMSTIVFIFTLTNMLIICYYSFLYLSWYETILHNIYEKLNKYIEFRLADVQWDICLLSKHVKLIQHSPTTFTSKYNFTELWMNFLGWLRIWSMIFLQIISS